MCSSDLREQGLILAATKFEFGLIDCELLLIDEASTPDSLRYWDATTYEVGTSPESFDKQFVRDWLTKQSGWDRKSLPPPLPDQVVEQTRERYLKAFERITGKSIFSNGDSQGGAGDPGPPGQRPQGGTPPSEQGGAGAPGPPGQPSEGGVPPSE